MLGICRNCRGAHTDNMEKGELDSNVTTLATGSFVPSETPVPSGEESMDQTPGPSGEQGTEEMPETADEELVLPRLRVRFQDDFLSQVINTTED